MTRMGFEPKISQHVSAILKAKEIRHFLYNQIRVLLNNRSRMKTENSNLPKTTKRPVFAGRFVVRTIHIGRPACPKACGSHDTK